MLSQHSQCMKVETSLRLCEMLYPSTSHKHILKKHFDTLNWKLLHPVDVNERLPLKTLTQVVYSEHYNTALKP